MITALLLAAGSARRFGAPKLLAPLAGKPVVRWSAEALADPLVAEVIVVAGARAAEIRDALAGLTVRVVVNARADRGMGASIACGMAAVSEGTSAVLVALADQPFLSREALHAVVARYRGGDVRIVAPTFRGTPGHPVLFDRAVFTELAALDGDRGARAVVERDRGRVARVEVGLDAPADVDTPADLARVARALQF